MTTTENGTCLQTVELAKRVITRSSRYRIASYRDVSIHRRFHKAAPWVDDSAGGKCCARCADRLVVFSEGWR